MNQLQMSDQPALYAEILAKSSEIGFTMPSDVYTGSLLKTLIASKLNSKVLELGTGVGLSLSWMMDGLGADSQIISIDNDPKLIGIVKEFFGNDPRLELICADGSEWIKDNLDQKFDLIFADAWPGKYSETEEALAMINEGGFYVIDDMTEQPNWPDGHQDNVDNLVEYLESRKDFTITKMEWSTGIIIMTKKSR